MKGKRPMKGRIAVAALDTSGGACDCMTCQSNLAAWVRQHEGEGLPRKVAKPRNAEQRKMTQAAVALDELEKAGSRLDPTSAACLDDLRGRMKVKVKGFENLRKFMKKRETLPWGGSVWKEGGMAASSSRESNA